MEFATFDRWLLQSAFFSTLMLLISCGVLQCIRQPIYRIRIIQGALLGCVIVPILQLGEFLPGFSLRILPVLQADKSTLNRPSSPISPQSMYPSLAGEFPRMASMPKAETAAIDSAAIQSMNPTNLSSRNLSPDSPSRDHLIGEFVTSPQTVSTFSWLHTVAFVVKTVYCAGVTSLCIVWCVGWLARRRMVAQSRPAQPHVQDVLRSVAGDQANRIRLLLNDQLRSPLMWGSFRPTIVVPTNLVDANNSVNLKYSLAHEWSHVSRGDFLTHSWASVISLHCFYQPLFWWLRRQLRLSQDYLADAFAASLGDEQDYASFLVTLARNRQNTEPMGVLCMADHRSALSRRIRMLVQGTIPLKRSAGVWATLAITVISASTFIGLGAVRLTAVSTATDPQEPIQESTGKVKEPTSIAKPLPDPITYKCKVTDRESGAPIAGCIVEVSHQLSRDPKTDRWIELEVTKHETDADGVYSFTLPPEQVAETSLYIEIAAFHKNYQPKGRSGYAHSMILKNIEHGDPPFFESIKLYKGEPVVVRVIGVDGRPVTNTRISAYTKAPSKEKIDWESGAFQNTRTDEKGEARITVPTPGDGVIWIYPKDAAPVALRIGAKRDQVREIKLKGGNMLTGKILNARGEPVANIPLEIRRDGDGEDVDEFLNNNAVSNGIETAALTDANGKFALRPLPPGNYSIKVSDRLHDPIEEQTRNAKVYTIDDVFVPMKVTLTDASEVEPIEIRAVPHVIVRGRFFDSKDKPRRGHEQNLFGKSDGISVFLESTLPSSDGWFEFKVPHGIQDAMLNFSTNEHSALRWRLKPDQPLQHGRSATLGTLEDDFTTIEIVRYEAPILLVKAIGTEGVRLPEFVPDSSYKSSGSDSSGGFVYGGNISFEKQPDGRWRSSQLLPDEEISISIKMEGYKSESQSVSISEGETRELIFEMKKADGS